MAHGLFLIVLGVPGSSANLDMCLSLKEFLKIISKTWRNDLASNIDNIKNIWFLIKYCILEPGWKVSHELKHFVLFSCLCSPRVLWPLFCLFFFLLFLFILIGSERSPTYFYSWSRILRNGNFVGRTQEWFDIPLWPDT